MQILRIVCISVYARKSLQFLRQLCHKSGGLFRAEYIYFHLGTNS